MKRSNSSGAIVASGQPHTRSITDSQPSQQLLANDSKNELRGANHRRKQKLKVMSYSCPTMNTSTFGSTTEYSTSVYEKSMPSSVDMTGKMSSLVDTTPPLNAVRLAPMKQEYAHSTVSLLPIDRLCLLFHMYTHMYVRTESLNVTLMCNGCIFPGAREMLHMYST